MIEIVVATLIGLVLVVGPLLWRVAKDRSESRALSIRAYVQSLVDRKLGGESFVSVQVTPRGYELVVRRGESSPAPQRQLKRVA
jgi:hypothetical protein